MKFQSLVDLEKWFTSGSADSLPAEITVDDVAYKKMTSTDVSFSEVFASDKKPIMVYSLVNNPTNKEKYEKKHTNADDATSFQDHILMVWALDKLKLLPKLAKFVPRARVFATAMREAEIPDSRIVHSKIGIVLNGFHNNSPIDAKVDTGADICSLHASDVKMNTESGLVSFVFGDKRVTMPLVTVQAIKTADNGIDNRPVVQFDVVIPNNDPMKKNHVLKKISFNLNDRSNMPDKVLLGQNFIKAGNFVVMNDNEQQESDGAAPIKQTESVDSVTAASPVEQMYTLMLEEGVTFEDLVRHIKTVALKDLERVEY